MIHRMLENIIQKKLNKGKAILLMGARQVGKTTLVKELFKGSDEMIWLNGDELDVQNLFENISSTRLKYIFGNKKYVVIWDKYVNFIRFFIISNCLPAGSMFFDGSADRT